ncbi:hypothetical protein F5883DRAFT_370009, partial [Diaporthe sp. PMI_573]
HTIFFDLSLISLGQHLFSKLPAELRWKIWAFNIPGPRLVSVHCGSKSLSCGLGSGHHHLTPSSSFGCSSQAKIPTNLHVCHESRREALRQYRASFGIARQPGQTFFDSEQDYLYFGPRDGFMASEANLRTVLSLCDPTELAQVRRVAVNEALVWVYDSAWHRQSPSSLLVDILRLVRARLPGLRELVLVPRDENPLYSSDCYLTEPAMAQNRLRRQVSEAM